MLKDSAGEAGGPFAVLVEPQGATSNDALLSRRAAYFFFAVFFLADFLTAFLAAFLAAFFLATLYPPLKKPGEFVSTLRRTRQAQRTEFLFVFAKRDSRLAVNKKPTSYRLLDRTRDAHRIARIFEHSLLFK